MPLENRFYQDGTLAAFSIFIKLVSNEIIFWRMGNRLRYRPQTKLREGNVFIVTVTTFIIYIMKMCGAADHYHNISPVDFIHSVPSMEDDGADGQFFCKTLFFRCKFLNALLELIATSHRNMLPQLCMIVNLIKLFGYFTDSHLK